MLIHRVFPWLPDVGAGEPGHPMHVPPEQGDSRIDNPAHYRVLYFSDTPAGAVAESFASRPVWREEMFVTPRLPGARRALATYEADIELLDLDEPKALLDRELRPSGIASSHRNTTQAWALSIFREQSWDGVRWWSIRDSRWAAIGLWFFESVRPLEPVPLTRDHPALHEAAEVLGKRWAA